MDPSAGRRERDISGRVACSLNQASTAEHRKGLPVANDHGIGEPMRLAYSIGETAQAVRVSVSTIERAIRDGEIASFKLGRRRLVSAEALAAWVRRKSEGGAA